MATKENPKRETKTGQFTKGTSKPNEYIATKDKGSFHVEIEQPAFDPATGQRLSKPSVQIFAPKDWLQFEENSIRLGWKYVILHEPKN